MKTEIQRYKPEREYFTQERCYINELLNATEPESLSVARARVEPGVTTQWHQLTGVTERYVIIEGQGRVELGDLPSARVGPGDVVSIPAGIRQRITNIGPEDLIFLCLCTPRFTPDCYQSLDIAD